MSSLCGIAVAYRLSGAPQSEYSEAQRGSIDAHAGSGTDSGGGTEEARVALCVEPVLMLDTASSALAPKRLCSAAPPTAAGALALVVAVVEEADEGERAPRKVLSLTQ
jgi:hypothetical protein